MELEAIKNFASQILNFATKIFCFIKTRYKTKLNKWQKNNNNEHEVMIKTCIPKR